MAVVDPQAAAKAAAAKAAAEKAAAEKAAAAEVAAQKAAKKEAAAKAAAVAKAVAEQTAAQTAEEEANATAVTQAATDTLASAVLQARLKLISREDLQRAIADARSAAVSEIAISAAEALLSKLPAAVSCSSQDWLVKSASLTRAETIGQGSFGTVYKVQVLSSGEWLAEKYFPSKTEAAEERQALERRLRREFRALQHAQHACLCKLRPHRQPLCPIPLLSF